MSPPSISVLICVCVCMCLPMSIILTSVIATYMYICVKQSNWVVKGIAYSSKFPVFNSQKSHCDSLASVMRSGPLLRKNQLYLSIRQWNPIWTNSTESPYMSYPCMLQHCQGIPSFSIFQPIRELFPKETWFFFSQKLLIKWSSSFSVEEQRGFLVWIGI